MSRLSEFLLRLVPIVTVINLNLFILWLAPRISFDLLSEFRSLLILPTSRCVDH